jgi:hypothetical protein
MFNWLKNCWIGILNISKTVKTLWRIASDAQYIATQERLLTALKRNHQLENDIKNLHDQLQINSDAKFDGEFLWLNGERICSNCYDKSDRNNRCVIRLLRNDDREAESFYCKTCNARFISEAARNRRRQKTDSYQQRKHFS